MMSLKNECGTVARRKWTVGRQQETLIVNVCRLPNTGKTFWVVRILAMAMYELMEVKLWELAY